MKRRRSLRQLALVLHRYVGLVMAVFLLSAGLTGALLAFYGELDALINPSLLRVRPPTPGAPLLEAFALQARVQPQVPTEDLHVAFDPEPGQALSLWAEVAPEKYREHFIDPYTGALLGSREWGNLSEGVTNLMPFLYRLHYSLALGETGSLLFGIVALLWTLDCFVGAYLTFPTATQRSGGPAIWVRRWLPAWQLRTGKLFSFVFTWHRASGLWVWALLLVFAWSAVGLNLRAVYAPVMGAVAGMAPDMHERLPVYAKPYPKPKLQPQAAHALGRSLMREQATQRGFHVEREASLDYHADHGAFQYTVRSSLDITNRQPRTAVYFDGQDGKLIGFDAASGLAAGSTITSWLYALHFASVGGTWYRIFVSLAGVAVAALSVTGVWIWLKKRVQRQRAA